MFSTFVALMLATFVGLVATQAHALALVPVSVTNFAGHSVYEHTIAFSELDEAARTFSIEISGTTTVRVGPLDDEGDGYTHGFRGMSVQLNTNSGPNQLASVGLTSYEGPAASLYEGSPSPNPFGDALGFSFSALAEPVETTFSWSISYLIEVVEVRDFRMEIYSDVFSESCLIYGGEINQQTCDGSSEKAPVLVLTTIPEPSTALLVGLGLIGIGTQRCRARAA